MKKILVIGANGQLGSDITKVLRAEGYDVLEVTHQDLDVADTAAIETFFAATQPEVVINTSAYHNVNLCEQYPEMAMQINAVAPGFIAALSRKMPFKFIHFSTDYVFDGNTERPYLENDSTFPLNEYGKSKALGELNVLKENPDNIIMRVSGLYGSNPCRAKNGLNFVQLMLKLAREKGEVKVVTDEIVSPTYTKNIAQQVAAMLNSEINGIVHSTSEGCCSWNEFAAAIFELTQTPVSLLPALSTDFVQTVQRPKYSVLENAKLKEQGINLMQDWKDALKAYLQELNP